MSMLNNVVGYWAYIRGTYIRWWGAYIWNKVSVSTCGGLVFGGGAYSLRFTVVFDFNS